MELLLLSVELLAVELLLLSVELLAVELLLSVELLPELAARGKLAGANAGL